MSTSRTQHRPVDVGLSTPQAIAAALPHLMGFHPQESLICLWLLDGELLVVQRADLPQTFPARDYLRAYLEAAENIRADEVLIICATRHVDLARELVHDLADMVDVAVRGRFLLSGGYVHDACGQDASSDGLSRWISPEDRQRAAKVFGSSSPERAVRRSRSDVVSEVEFDRTTQWHDEDEDDETAAQDVTALAHVLARGDWSMSQSQRLLRDGSQTVPGRDLVMWWCARLDSAQRGLLLVALLAGLRATRQGAHLACATAGVAWMCGDGVRANAALDRCLREDPSNVMGQMLESAMAAAVAPSVFAQMLADVEPDVVGLDRGLVDEISIPGYSHA